MQANRPSLRQLDYFLSVAEHESFRRAAERRGVSQPTLTAQIAALEKALGIRLFERSRAGTRLSPAGRELVPHARGVLDQLGGFVDAAELLRRGPGGTFRLGATPTLGPYLLPYLLPDLHRAYAQLRLYVREEDPRSLEEGLANGRYDLLLTTLPLDADEFAVVPLFCEPVRLAIAADHPLASRERITAADLHGADILTIEEHHRFYRQVEQLCKKLGAHLLRDYQGTSLDALRHMVVMGMGHAFLPALYVQSEIHEQSQLRIVELDGDAMQRVHALVWRNSSPARSFFQRLGGDLQSSIRKRLKGIVQTID